MSRLSKGLVALVVALAGAASAETVRIEGVYTTETQYNTRGSESFPLSTPIPLTLDLQLFANPSAPVVGDGDSASVWFEQTHARQDVSSTQYSAPHPLTAPTMQRLQSWQNRPFSAAVFADYADPRYDATTTTMSRSVDFGAPEFNRTSWTFQVNQRWADGSNPNYTEQWESLFIVELSRLTDPQRDITEPMTAGDLTSFLDGFEEAGGIVHVTNLATLTLQGDQFSRNTIGFSGDFHIASVSQPIPEPETYALMLLGAGLVGWQVRRRRL